MRQVKTKNENSQDCSWWRRPLQIAIIILAASFGFILRVNFLEKSN